MPPNIVFSVSAGVVDAIADPLDEAFVECHRSAVLVRPGVDPRFVAAESSEMASAVSAKTACRQVLGVMNEFVFMAEHAISTGRSDPSDLLGLSVWLASTIVGPISKDDGYTSLGALETVVAVTLDG